MARWCNKGERVKPSGTVVLTGRLYAIHIAPDGRRTDYGLVSDRKVTDAFAGYLVDCLKSSTAGFATFKYHDCGTGVGAEDAGDVALGTPYGGARAVGSQVEGATANIYKSVGTVSFTGAATITEHGLFNASSSGVLMDRSLLSPTIAVINGSEIEFTYELTVTAGG